MELFVLRKEFSEECTISELVVDHRILRIIEDKDRGLYQTMSEDEIAAIKVYGKTCIPYGRYEIVITQSPRFTKLRKKPVFLPQLLDVKGFSGIRIHPANYASQLEGCLAPGLRSTANSVIDSRKAHEFLFEKINLSIRDGQRVYINIDKI
jgi:hypothetical protein